MANLERYILNDITVQIKYTILVMKTNIFGSFEWFIIEYSL